VSQGIIKRKRVGRVGIACRAVAVLCCCLPALAAADTGQDGDIAALKAATLDLIQSQPVPADPEGSLAIYIGDRDPGLLLDEIEVWIDDAPPLRYEYSDREAVALHLAGLYRLGLVTLAPGVHRFRADFAARYTGASPDRWRVTAVLERKISIAPQPAMLELEATSGSYIGKPELQFHPLSAAAAGTAADSFVPGSRDDPRLRFAAFLTATDRPFAGAVELLQLQARLHGVAPSADFQLQLAEALQGFDLTRAPAVYKDSAGADAREGDGMAQSYADYNRGVSLMKDGQGAAGEALLAAVAAGKADTPESAALRDRANLVLGYAQLRNRTGGNAVPLFSSVRSPGPYANAALLGLGWALLAPSGNGQNTSRQTQGAAPFQRIPVLLQPQLTGDIATLKRHEPYSLKPATPQEEQALRRALVPWVELTGRDPLDPAVQEGMIAIPYALNHIGAYEEAQEDYVRAVKLLEAVDVQLDVAKQRVGDGQMIQALDTREAANNGWPWWLAAYPKEHWWLADDPSQPLGAPETFYLQHLMAGDDFRAALQDFHDLRLLSDALERMSGAGGSASLEARIASATTAQAGLLRELAIAELEREQGHTRMYLGEARFALARMNEPAQAVAAK